MPGQLVDDINDVLVSRAGQFVANCLNQKGTDPTRPSLVGMVEWDDDADPKGLDDKVLVSGNDSAGTFPEGGPFNEAGRTERVPRSHNYSRYHFVLELTGTDEAKIEAAADRQMAIANFITREFEHGNDAVFDLMDEHLATNDPEDPSGAPDGFTGMSCIAHASNTLYNVDATLYPITGAHVNTAGSPRALTLELMEDTSDVFEDSVGGRYDYILTSRTQLRAYTRLDGATNPGAPTPNLMTFTSMDGQERHYSAGYVSAWFNGKPVLSLQNYPNDVMDYVQRGFLKGKVLRNWQVKKFILDDKTRFVVIFEALVYCPNRRKMVARLAALS